VKPSTGSFGGLTAASALAFATAGLIMTFLHELWHALAARALGFHPRVYAFVEDNPSGTPTQDVLIAAAGPIGSLIAGLFFFAILRLAAGRRYTYANILLFWMAIHGIMNFINYLIVTPWLVGGDTWAIAQRLGVSLPWQYAATIVGVLLLLFFGPRAARATLDIAPPSVALATPRDRRFFLRRFYFAPVTFGIALVLVACLRQKPVYILYAFLGMVGNYDICAVASGSPGKTYERPPEAALGQTPALGPGPIGLYVLSVLFYLLVLTPGLPI
jgi:hypothetical protein